MDTEASHKYLADNATKNYKEEKRSKINRINFDMKKIAEKLAIVLC